MQKLAANLTEKMLRRKLISPEQAEWCAYLVECKLEQMLCFSVLIALGCLIAPLWEVLLLNWGVVFLRRKANGLHLHTFWGCMLSSLFCELTALWACEKVTPAVAVLLLTISLLTLCLAAPVNDVNIHFDSDEMQALRGGMQKRLAVYVHHQKNFTPDDLPLLCQKNSGQLPQYYVQNHHKALVSRQEFEKVQTLLKRKGTERKNQNTCAFSNKLYCAECGSVFSRKVRANGVVVWGCRKHLDKSELCPVKPVYEADLCRVFLSMYNKLQANRDKVLRPAMDDLASLRYLQEQRNSERVTITEEIQRLGKQNHNLERLRTTGCIDSAQYWERRAVIEQQLIEKKALLMRRFFNKNVEKVLRQTKGISTRLAAGPPLTDFDEAAFTALVSRVKISSTAITFGLINGMNLPEGRTEP